MSGYTATIAVVVSAISAGVGAYSSYAQGEAQKEQADYQSKLYENQAEAERLQALDAQNRAAADYAQKQDDKRRMISTQRAKASGVNADTGTMGQLQDETSTLASLDALKLLNNGQREAWGFNNASTNSLASAAGSTFAGNNAMTAGMIGADSSLLSGAATTSSMAYKFKKDGAWG